MQIRWSIYVLVVCFSLICCSRHAEPLKQEEWKSRLNAKALEMKSEISINIDRNSHVDSSLNVFQMPTIEELHQRVLKVMEEKGIDETLSSIEEGGQVDQNLEKIYFHVYVELCSITQNGFQLDSGPFMLSAEGGSVEEYLALKFNYLVERAIAIESINPTPDEVKKIQSQLLEVKEIVSARVIEKFPNWPSESIEKGLELAFVYYDLGPTSVMTRVSKRVIPKDQFAQILNTLKTKVPTGRFMELLQQRIESLEQHQAKEYLKDILFSPVQDYAVALCRPVLLKTYRELVKQDYNEPVKSQRLRYLEKRFE